MAMANNEHTIVGDLLASAKEIDRLFTQTQSLQALLGRARTTSVPIGAVLMSQSWLKNAKLTGVKG